LRLQTPDGMTSEWRRLTLRTYQRRTLAAEALIAGAYLEGANTRRVQPLALLFPRRWEQGIVRRI
jgi:putative transposase